MQHSLDLTPASRPELVWLLRDHLQTAIKDLGVEPQPYTHLSERMRAAASIWFPLRDAAGDERPQ